MKISIITPLHNKGKYVAETIESVLGQTHDDWEMIIVENHSTDEGPEIAKQYARKDDRIRFVEADPEIKGPGAARNLGLKQASGGWILFLDADDLIGEDYLKMHLKIALNGNNYGIVTGGWREFYDTPENFTVKNPAGINGSTDLRDYGIAFCPWALHAAIIKRNLFDSAEMLWESDEVLPMAEDHAFWFRLIQQTSVGYDNSNIAYYRRFKHSSRTDITPDRWYQANRQVTDMNLIYIKKLGHELTLGQYEFLMRLYEGISISALQKNDSATFLASFNDAKYYLEKTQNTSMSIRLRKIIGLKLFLIIKKYISLI